MASYNWASIDSGNDLMSDGTKPYLKSQDMSDIVNDGL